jgi:ribosome-associated protein
MERLRSAAGKRLTTGDELLLVSQESRSQHDNRQRCLERLRDLVRRSRRSPRKRRPTKPTRGSVERRIKEKKQRGQQKRQRGGEWS